MLKPHVLAVLALTPILLATSGAARADDVENFYKTATVSLVVGFTPGGGYDQYARVLSRYLGHHIPGNPTVIVQNMPGAGSLTSVKYLDANAPADGTIIAVFNNGLLVQSATIPDKVNVNFTDVAWLGSITPDYRVCYAWGATGVKSYDEMVKRKEFVLGSTGKGSGNYVNGSILRMVLKAPVKQILGFPGSAEQRLAIEQGELDGDCGSWTSIPIEWIDKNKINTFVRFSPTRPDMIPDSARYVGEFAADQHQKDLIELLSSGDQLGRPLVMSKRVPADRLKAMRDAFDATMKDQGFVADAKKQNLLVDPANYTTAEQIAAKIAKAPPALAAEAKDVME